MKVDSKSVSSPSANHQYSKRTRMAAGTRPASSQAPSTAARGRKAAEGASAVLRMGRLGGK